MESSKETGCQAPEGPILCINNCGFFGSAATMNMCSKCHKEMISQQDQAKLAASSIENIVNGGGSSGNTGNDTVAAVLPTPEEVEVAPAEAPPSSFSLNQLSGASPKEGPNRCNICRKRVGLMGFSCRCGNLFCASHRYSDQHDCPYDYQKAGRNAIAKANPVVKAKKVDKI